MCGAYMTHADTHKNRCVCPECGNSCDVCMGERNGRRIEKADGKIDIPEELLAIYGERKK